MRLVRPAKLPLESPEGFRLRVAAANGLRRPAWIGPAQSLGAAEAASPKPWRTSRIARFCPSCLSEDAIWHEAWTCAAIPLCLRHSVVLSDLCQQCGQHLAWNRARLEHCACGALLKDQSLRRLSESGTRLASSLGGRPSTDLSIGGCFASLTLAEASRFILAVGTPLVWPGAKRPQRTLRRSSLEECVRVFEAAAEVVDEWPTNFVRRLDELMRESLLNGRRGPSVVFRRLRSALSSDGHSDGLSFVRNELDSFLENNWPYGLDNRNRLGAPSRLQNFPLAVAASRLKMRPARLVALAKRQDVQLTQSVSEGGRRRFSFVNKRDFARMMALSEDEISTSSAGRMLGVSRRRVIELVRGDVLHAASIGTSGSAVVVSKRSVAQLITAVLGLATVRGTHGSDLIGLRTALRASIPVAQSASFFQAMLTGRIAAFRTSDSKDLSELKVSIADLQREKGGRISATEELTAVQAARRLGVKQEVLYGLLRRQLIRSHCGTGAHRRQTFVWSQDIHTFTQKFVTARELAQQSGTSPREAVRRLARASLLPVVGPSIDGSRQYFFSRRNDLLRKVKGRPAVQHPPVERPLN